MRIGILRHIKNRDIPRDFLFCSSEARRIKSIPNLLYWLNETLEFMLMKW